MCSLNNNNIGPNLKNIIAIEPRIVMMTNSTRTQRQRVKISNESTEQQNVIIFQTLPTNFKITSIGDEGIILPGFGILIDIIYEPNLCSKKTFESFYYKFGVEIKRPKLRVAIPIIFLNKRPGIFLPRKIRMPQTSPDVPAYYETAIINRTSKTIVAAVKKQPYTRDEDYHSLEWSPTQFTINRKSFQIIRFEIFSKKISKISTKIYVLFPEKNKICIELECDCIKYKPDLSSNLIEFPSTPEGFCSEKIIQIFNDSPDMIKYKWCRMERKTKTRNSISGLYNERNLLENFNMKILQFGFQIKPRMGVLGPFSSTKIQINYSPTFKTYENMNKYSQCIENAYLAISTDEIGEDRIGLRLCGAIKEPTIRFETKHFDLGQLYLSESRFLELKVANIGFSCEKILLLGIENSFGGTINILPKEMELDANDFGVFIIKYSNRIDGKFLEKILFKTAGLVQPVDIFISGQIIPLEITTSLDDVNFGDVGICILQKQSFTVKNLTHLPIVIVANVKNDGYDEPLLFHEFRNNQKNPTVASNDYERIDCMEEEEDSTETGELPKAESLLYQNYYEELFNDFQYSGNTYSSIADSESSFSYNSSSASNHDFYHFLLEKVPEISKDVLEKRKEEKLPDPDVDLNVISKVFHKNSSYLDKLWVLPEHPKQWSVNCQPIFIQPNQSATLLVKLIPNSLGPYTVPLDLQATTVALDADRNPYRDIFSMNQDMEPVRRIILTHKCVLPHLVLSNNYYELETFVEMAETLELTVRNDAEVDGFITLHLQTVDGVDASITPTRSVIKAQSGVDFEIKIFTKNVGMFKLQGAVIPLGSEKGSSFRIVCHIKPPKIKISPPTITIMQNVLERKDTKLFITNISPTKARFFIKMDDANVFCYPKGGILGPGQCVLILLTSEFSDPGKYTKTIPIHVQYFGEIIVPLKYTIKGIPIRTDPDLEKGLHLGNIKTMNTKQVIVFENFGSKSYKISIRPKWATTTTNSGKSSCCFSFNPNSFCLAPGDKDYTIVSTRYSSSCTVIEEFCLNVASEKDYGQFCSRNFLCCASFITDKDRSKHVRSEI